MKDLQTIKLVIPMLLSCNGRIILQAVPKKDMVSKGGIIIPVSTEIWTNERKPDRERVQEDNPYKNYYFFAVAWSPEVDEQLRLKDGKPLRVADMVRMSERFEPILYAEGLNMYFLIHWQDTLGVIRQEKLVEMKIEVTEPEY